jgi:hypothetical protein
MLTAAATELARAAVVRAARPSTETGAFQR